MKKVLFYLVQWTWGLTVNLAGLLAHLFVRRKGKSDYHLPAVEFWRAFSGIIYLHGRS